MAKLPLWDLPRAKRGERDAGPKALRALAARLRGAPSPDDLAEVAEMLERAADGGAEGAAQALYLSHAKRPRETDREMQIWQAVDRLTQGEGMTLAAAYNEVADAKKNPQFMTVKRGIPAAITPKRVEEIYLAWRRVERDCRIESFEQMGFEDALLSTAEGRQWDQWARDGRRWVEEASMAYEAGLEALRRRQTEYRRWIAEEWRPAVNRIVESRKAPRKR